MAGGEGRRVVTAVTLADNWHAQCLMINTVGRVWTLADLAVVAVAAVAAAAETEGSILTFIHPTSGHCVVRGGVGTPCR